MNLYLFSSTQKGRPSLLQIFTVLLFIFYTVPVAAQSIVLTGKVVDDKGAPIAFATIVLKGTSIGTSADHLGKFRITATLPVTIVCSIVGYESIEKKIEKRDTRDSVIPIEITLLPSKHELSSVVVTAFGSTRSEGTVSYSTATVSGLERDMSPSPGVGMKVRGISSTLTADRKLYHTPDTVTPGYEKGTLSGKRSGLLTAGELNDFKKWNMWEDYSQAQFKTHSEKWQLYSTERYCVQLQNTEKKALVGERVFLISKTTGDTLWTAVSDNTGKAELWNGFIKKSKDRDFVIAVDKENKQFPAIPFMQGINRIVVNRSCAVSKNVEIAFVVDATGSMQDEINYLKEELEDVLDKITLKDSSIHLHTGAVFYRDNGDAYVSKVQELTNGISNTTSFIKQQDAGGGGDYPEAVNEGLQSALHDLQWNASARTRIIFLLMDAPPHDEARDELAALIVEAAAKGIRIVPVACSGTDKATEFIMRSMALATNGSYLFLTDDSGIGNSHIKPTTDEFKVELLNNLLQRIIEQMCYVNSCEEITNAAEPLASYTNTENVKLFPNPTTGPVTLQTTKKLKEIFIADFTGKLLKRIQVNQKPGYHFNLSTFPAGTYFIKYVTEKNIVGAEKLVLAK